MSVCLFCLHKQENKKVFNRITLLLYIKSEEACVLYGDTGYSTQQLSEHLTMSFEHHTKDQCFIVLSNTFCNVTVVAKTYF